MKQSVHGWGSIDGGPDIDVVVDDITPFLKGRLNKCQRISVRLLEVITYSQIERSLAATKDRS